MLAITNDTSLRTVYNEVRTCSDTLKKETDTKYSCTYLCATRKLTHISNEIQEALRLGKKTVGELTNLTANILLTGLLYDADALCTIYMLQVIEQKKSGGTVCRKDRF